MSEEYKIRFENISMLFPGVVALTDVSLGVKPGTVHIFVGENGAGKSTLMKILNGTYTATDGKVFVDDQEVAFNSALDAERNGIVMIYQELQYFPNLSVEKYLMLCREPQKAGIIQWKKVSEEAKSIMETEGFEYNLKQNMNELSVSDIQLLEITRAITAPKTHILIMDEPTSALSTTEVERLFKNIRRLKERGITILYISHKMDEIFRIADYITVMRDGQHIKTAPASEFNNDSLVKMMVGRELSSIYPKEDVPIGDTILEVENLWNYQTKICDINLHVKAGEIVGLAGLMGAGRTETVQTIFGLNRMDEGVIKVEGKPVKIRDVTDAVNNGIAMATEDRRRYGLVLCRDIEENISYSSLKKISVLGFVNRKKEKNETQKFFEQLQIKAPGLATIVKTLSGGNQQKVVLAKWMMADPKILILDEPTRGIDVGAKYEIYKIMTALAKRGIGIIMISSELPEFIGMCDRAYTMYEGRITGELSRDEMTQEKIVMLSTGGER